MKTYLHRFFLSQRELFFSAMQVNKGILNPKHLQGPVRGTRERNKQPIDNFYTKF